MRTLWFLTAALIVVFPLHAQLEPYSPECSLGLKYDSGVFGGAINSPNPNWIGVMRFDLPEGTTGLRQVCVRIQRTGSLTAPATVPYDIVIFDDNGPSGRPGTLIKSISGTATFPAGSGLISVNADLTGSGLTLPDLGVFVGIRMSGNQVFLPYDTTPSTPARTLFFSDTNGFSWAPGSANVKAFGIRVDPIPECISTPTALCLNGRFMVEATYTTASSSGSANVVRLTNETGYLWFFNATNVEVVIKVLNACGINSAYWVFAGGLTDVNTVIKVTDVRNGQVKTYTNPQGTPFQPIQDVNAFTAPGTCP